MERYRLNHYNSLCSFVEGAFVKNAGSGYARTARADGNRKVKGLAAPLIRALGNQSRSGQAAAHELRRSTTNQLEMNMFHVRRIALVVLGLLACALDSGAAEFQRGEPLPGTAKPDKKQAEPTPKQLALAEAIGKGHSYEKHVVE